jgi:hypothetical protein
MSPTFPTVNLRSVVDATVTISSLAVPHRRPFRDRSANIEYLRCVAGKRAFPPEGCGGTGGFAEICRVVGDPTNAEDAGMLE